MRQFDLKSLINELKLFGNFTLARKPINREALCNIVTFHSTHDVHVAYFREDMKRRTLAGNCGVAVFAIAFVCIAVAFTTPSWLVSDYRITGAKLDRLGLWVHCFRSLPDVNDDYQRRFFVGCRWVYDPFTTGYDEIRGFLIPRKSSEVEQVLMHKLTIVSPFTAFMIITQFFMTLAFIAIFVSLILVLLYFLCGGPDQKHFLLMIKV